MVRMMNAQLGNRVSITVDGDSSPSSVVSGSWIATLTVRAKSSSRNASRQHEGEHHLGLDLAQHLGRDGARVGPDVGLESLALWLRHRLLRQGQELAVRSSACICARP